MTVPIDYTSRDFDSIKEALKAHVQAKFPNTWRDFYESQMGMAWLELIAYVFDVLSFYLDYQANETYLETARDRLSVLNLGKLVGYRMRTATSASVTATGTISAVQAVDVIVQSGTTIQTEKGITFRTIEDQTIPVGSTSADIVFVEGDNQNDLFSSDGSAFQKFQLTVPGVIDGSLTVLVDGSAWNLEDSLVYGDGDSEIYDLTYDDDDNATIRFGDGTSGKIPPIGAVISVTYRIGGGVQGNIGVGELTGTVSGVLSGVVPITTVDVTINNTERGSGGEERETIEHAKLWIPRWVRTNGRAVTRDDFDTLANTFSDPVYGSPAFARAKLRQDIPELNTVDLYVWARDSQGDIVAASTALKNSIETYFNNNGSGAVRVICTDVEVQDGEIVYVDAAVEVKVDSDYASAEVLTNVINTIGDLFSASYNVPGEDFRISRVFESVQKVLGVEYSLVNRLTASKKFTEIIGTGDGVTKIFSGTLSLDPGLPVVENTCSITDGSATYTDDGNGNLVDSGSSVVGSIDYSTGAYSITFSSAPASSNQIVFAYRNVIDFQRGKLETTADGTTARFKGALNFPPAVPYTLGQKGVAFTDGEQVVIDDGSGKFTGDVDATGINTIDYDTGAYDFTFKFTPSNGSEIRSTYRQMLRSPSEDLPITDTQLATGGLITATAITA